MGESFLPKGKDSDASASTLLATGRAAAMDADMSDDGDGVDKDDNLSVDSRDSDRYVK